jgi:hypothetical protein
MYQRTVFDPSSSTNSSLVSDSVFATISLIRGRACSACLGLVHRGIRPPSRPSASQAVQAMAGGSLRGGRAGGLSAGGAPGAATETSSTTRAAATTHLSLTIVAPPTTCQLTSTPPRTVFFLETCTKEKKAEQSRDIHIRETIEKSGSCSANMVMQRPQLSEHGPITLDERAGPRADGAGSSGGEDSRPAAGGGERAPGHAGMECVPAPASDAKGFWCFALERRGIRLSSWTLLTLFIYCNLLNYVDRGLVNGMLPQYCVNCQTRTDAQGCRAMASCEWRAGNATGNATCAFNASVLPRLGIGGSLKIKETAQGVIAGSFMGGYCVFSPIFAYLSTLYKPFNLMGLGLSAWCIACALATVAPSFGTPETLCHRSHMRIQAHAGHSLSLTHAQTHARTNTRKKLRSDAHARTRTHRDLDCCAGGVGDWRGELPMHWCTQSQKYST